MILTEADVPVYAPTLNLSGQELTAALYLVDAKIRGYLNRDLELKEYTEICQVLPREQLFYVSYFPIVIPPDPVVEVRFMGLTRFNRPIGVGKWDLLSSDQYQVDPEIGQVSLDLNAPFFGYAIRGGRKPGRTDFDSEARITYSAGIDFSQDTTEVRRLKSAAAEILKYTQSNQYLGIKSVALPFEEAKVEFETNRLSPGEIPEFFFHPFEEYKLKVKP